MKRLGSAVTAVAVAILTGHAPLDGTITAYGLGHCHGCFGLPGYHPTWYRWLHVVSKGGQAGGAARGPFDLRINVAPGT